MILQKRFAIANIEGWYKLLDITQLCVYIKVIRWLRKGTVFAVNTYSLYDNHSFRINIKYLKIHYYRSSYSPL